LFYFVCKDKQYLANNQVSPKKNGGEPHGQPPKILINKKTGSEQPRSISSELHVQEGQAT